MNDDFTRRMAEFLAKVPLPPKAITYEHGCHLLDELQDIARDMALSDDKCEACNGTGLDPACREETCIVCGGTGKAGVGVPDGAKNV